MSSAVQVSPYPNQKKQVSKRKVIEKTVVKVKIGADGDQKLKNEFPPSDSWSWRKYGQKPIKGSPYPRGYYRCSTAKGCSAKKQVERSKEDASMVVITYTSGHNHPGLPVQSPCSLAHQQQPTSPSQAQQPPSAAASKTNDQHQKAAEKADLQEEEEEKPYVVTFENNSLQDEQEKPISWSEMMMSLSSSRPLSGGENEFFDELGELPHTTASSSFTSFMRSSFFDERMVVPHTS